MGMSPSVSKTSGRNAVHLHSLGNTYLAARTEILQNIPQPIMPLSIPQLKETYSMTGQVPTIRLEAASNMLSLLVSYGQCKHSFQATIRLIRTKILPQTQMEVTTTITLRTLTITIPPIMEDCCYNTGKTIQTSNSEALSGPSATKIMLVPTALIPEQV